MRTTHTSKLVVPVGRLDSIRGAVHPSVMIVEYGDYQCPHCIAAHEIVSEILSDMHEQLGFVFRNFPVSNVHPYAVRAAEAAEAARAQGKFWEMHDLLFETRDLEEEDLIGHADTLELDLEQFEKDLHHQKYLPRIQDDFNQGIRSGVKGTPTFFINGVRHKGSYDLASLLSGLFAQRN